MARVQSNFRCTECGWTTPKWAGRCAECQAWGTILDVAESPSALGRGLRAVTLSEDRAAKSIVAISADEVAHWPSGIAEFDRVLGGGIVPGATILLSGEPGVGKSTLLLEVASKAAANGMRVLYVTAE